jgi:hypothetical protein
VNTAECLNTLRLAGVEVSLSGSVLRFKVPPGRDIPTLQAIVDQHRDALLSEIEAQEERAAIIEADQGTVRCPRHGTDSRAWCSECGPAFSDDLPLEAVDAEGRLLPR